MCVSILPVPVLYHTRTTLLLVQVWYESGTSK